jgi:hypothetical protein
MSRLRLTAIAFAVCLAPGVARAQLCHTGPVGHDEPAHDRDHHHAHHHHGDHHQEGAPHHLEASLAVEGAQIEGGAYQGVAPSLRWHHGRIGAFVVVPAYRLERDAMAPVLGLGDVLVQGQARIVGSGRWQAGAAVALGLPTGEAADGLGMGHLMVMPGAWVTVTRGRAGVQLSTTVGRGFGGGEHAHHGPGSVVNPMNRFELGGTARASLAVAPSLTIHAVGMVGLPLDDGITRAAAGTGARWRRRAWSLGAEVQLGVAGDPFTTRGIVSLGHSR